MAAGTTTTTQISPRVQAIYMRGTLERALPFLAHGLFGQQKPFDMNSGDTPTFRRYNSMALATAALVEGVTPDPQQASKTDVTASPAQYGSYLVFSDRVIYTNQDPILSEYSMIIGENMGQSLDVVYRDVLNAGTSVYRANGVATRAEVTTLATVADLDKIFRALRKNNAQFYANKPIAGSPAIGTTPVRQAYYAVCSPDIVKDLRDITASFVDVSKYPVPSEAIEGEVGMISGFRIVESTQAKVFAGEGASGSTYAATGGNYDVHTMLIFGKNAYGVVPLSNKNMEVIIHAIGTGGASDPLNQRGTIGWKAFTTAVILNDSFMYRYEVCVSK